MVYDQKQIRWTAGSILREVARRDADFCGDVRGLAFGRRQAGQIKRRFSRSPGRRTPSGARKARHYFTARSLERTATRPARVSQPITEGIRGLCPAPPRTGAERAGRVAAGALARVDARRR